MGATVEGRGQNPQWSAALVHEAEFPGDDVFGPGMVEGSNPVVGDRDKRPGAAHRYLQREITEERKAGPAAGSVGP